MAVYLELFHGRKTPDEELDGWGSNGPVFGPLAHVHTTYANDIKLGEVDPPYDQLGELHVVDDLVYYDGAFYGDWSVFGAEQLDAELTRRLTIYDEQKAEPPGTVIGPDGWRMIPTKSGGENGPANS